MEELAVVVKTEGEFATVRLTRHTTCQHCGACGLGANAATGEFKVLNPIGARPGQRVRVRMAAGTLYRAAFLVYILPMLGLVLGYLLGRWIARRFAAGFAEGIGILAGFAVMAVFFIVLYLYDRHYLKPAAYLPEIAGLAEDEGTPESAADSQQ